MLGLLFITGIKIPQIQSYDCFQLNYSEKVWRTKRKPNLQLLFQNYCPFQELRGVFYTTAIISTIIVIDLKTEICILRKTSLQLNACQWYMIWQRILIHANIKYHLGLDWKLKKAV